MVERDEKSEKQSESGEYTEPETERERSGSTPRSSHSFSLWIPGRLRLLGKRKERMHRSFLLSHMNECDNDIWFWMNEINPPSKSLPSI